MFIETQDDAERHRRFVDERRAARERELAAPGSRTSELLTQAGARPRYFPTDLGCRVPVELEPAAVNARAHLERITGESQDLPLVGLVRGALGDHPFCLEVARLPDGRVRADFRDATSGSESFGFRYVNVDRDDDGQWWIDFNLAHNPLCAYGDGFRCLLPPPQNTLAFPIRAGERRFG